MRLFRAKNLRVALFGVGLGCIPFNVGPALAHNTLDSSTPIEGDVLAEPPTTWTLRFEKSVPLDSASGQVIDQGGVRTPLAPPVHGETENVIVFPLPTDLMGAVTARWRLVGVDGHVISGRVSFEIASATAPQMDNAQPAVDVYVPIAATEVDDPAPPIPRPLSYVIRYIDLVLLVGLIGLIIIELGHAQGTAVTSRGASIARIGSVGLVITGLIQALSFTAELNGISLISAVGKVVTALRTTPGAMLYMQPILAALLVAQFRKGTWTSRRTDAVLLSAIVGMFLVSRAYTGHSRSEGWALVGIPLEVIHTIAAAAWLGGLAILLACVVSSVAFQDAIRAFRSFGRMADFAIPAILITGFTQTLNMHGGIETITSSPHGRVLVVKFAFVGAMLAVGFINRRRLRHMLSGQGDSPANLRQLIRASVLETGIGLTVVAVTAALVTTSLG